jgi:hypothetical protein
MDRREYWRELCEQVKSERDPDRLMQLVEQLNRALEERETEHRFRLGPEPASLDS